MHKQNKLMIQLYKCLFIFFLLQTNAHSQDKNAIWQKLHNNEREEALQLINTIDAKNDIESFILKKLVLLENGSMQCNPKEIEALVKYENYENYLFSNWKIPYVFNDYLDHGFDIYNIAAAQSISASKIKNTTVKNGLYYLQAVTKRYQYKQEEYKELMGKINSIRDWEHCGVFENLNSSGIDISYPPENNASPNAIFDARSKGEVSWYMPRKNNEVYQFFTNHSEYGAGVHYAQTFIQSPKTQRVRLKLGKSGLIRVYINDVLIVEEDDSYVTEMDAYTYELNLQKGVNRVLIKSASKGGDPYFILRLEDINGKEIEGLNITFKNRNYVKSDLKSINPVYIPHKIETFFETRLLKNIGDTNLNKFCLFLTYTRNGRYENAIMLLEEWLNIYPNSSFIKSCLMSCYEEIGDETTLKKIQDNVLRLDPKYYLSIMHDFENMDDIMNLDIQAYEAKFKEIRDATDYSYMKTFAEFMILLRQGNKDKLKEILQDLLINEDLPSSIKLTFLDFYASLFNDDDKVIEILEEYNKDGYDYTNIGYLAYYYKKQNRNEEAIQLYLKSLKDYGYDNNIYYDLINLLHGVGEYKRSLSYIDEAIKNFPNTYIFTKFKGNALLQLDKKQEAIELYNLAYTRKPSDSKLRKTIYDLQNKKNPLEQFHLKNAYEYIKQNRGKIKNNNYGLNELLNQTDILSYKNGGGEYRVTLLYEITSQNGIDIFKEYNLGLYGNYSILKSEAVKLNGDTAPAEKNGADLVFANLAIGDVIYIDYLKHYSNSGRFYRDYIFSTNFGGYHPSLKKVYRLLTKDKKVNFSVENGEVTYKNYKEDNLYVHEWEVLNDAGLPVSEDYKPTYVDVVNRLNISSIEQWSEIANWYSDLVRKQLRLDDVVEKTFNDIFPKGVKNITETERAKKIYYYITDNLNYSHVNFRQSGFVPQKPSKTIKTQLGDCKDFSALFLVLAKKAGLKGNMVLILTSDKGKNKLVLPSSDFNHCIVKVEIEGKEQFLELTDKYLPYRALPMSLREATGLVIPYESSTVNNKYNLFHFKDELRILSHFKNEYVIDIKPNESIIDLKTSITGHLASFYIETLQNEKGNILKEKLQEEILNRASEPINLISIDEIDINRDNASASYKSKLKLDLKINKIGELSAFKIPHFFNAYTRSIVNLEKRSYPISYIKYENADSYEENIILKLEENKKFIEIPENVNYKFKEHEFSVVYKLLKINELRVSITSKVNSSSIQPEEYKEFKEFVEKVLDTRETFIVFK